MENFEKLNNISENAVENELREYFESYISEAESQETEENREAYIDLDKIKAIVSDLDSGDYESALDYVDSEIERMSKMHKEFSEKGWNGDIEEGVPYVERLNRLKDYLVSQQA